MKKITWISVLVMLLASCESALEKYYSTPDWLKGNAWEVMVDKGNYTLFMEAISKTSYLDLVQGKGIITVMAPTDEAFGKYLQKKGYNSVSDIPAGELNKLVAYHLVYYSFSKTSFENYKPNGIESENELNGIYYKFRTKSRDDIQIWTDPTENNAVKRVMHKERFLPVFSHSLFESQQIDAKTNFEYFYPGSVWSGANGFNVSNASVNEYAIVTDNGYLYSIDQVLEPLETVYANLQNEPDFSVFRKAYDRFVQFDYDATASSEYGNGDSLFIRSHGIDLPAISSEWTNLNLGTDYTQLATLSRRSFNVFAPDNTSMNAFFQKYWAKYYSSMDSVNFIPLIALLTNHVNSGDILFPETIEKGMIKSPLGTPIVFNRTDAQLRKICVNGTLYGLNKVLEPSLFNKVTAPAFINPAYNIMLDMMVSSNYVYPLLSDQLDFKVFFPTDQMLELNTTLEGRMIKYVNTNKLKYGRQSLQIEGDLGLEDMNVNQKRSLAGSHIATRLIMQKGDSSVYATLNAFNYIYTIKDKVYSSALYNINDSEKTPSFKLIDSYSNGKTYELTGVSASALVPETNQLKNILTSVASPADYEYFKALVQAASLDKTTPPYNFLLGERFVLFVPNANAILNGFNAGKIPFSPADKVASFLKPYFVNVSLSSMIDYPFPGSGTDMHMVTFGKNSKGEEVVFRLLDKGDHLVVIDAKGKEVKVTSVLPRIYADGAVYMINDLLDIE